MEQTRVSGGKGKIGEGVREETGPAEETQIILTIPTRIKVGPFYVNVEQHEGYWNKDDIRVYGEFDERTMTINIDIDASMEVIRETLVHELLHVILSMYSRDDEELVRLVSPMLRQVMRDNRDLMYELIS